MTKKMVNEVVQVAYHRNGICGNGFHAVLFETSTDRCARCRGFATLGTTGRGVTVCTSCCAGLANPVAAEIETTRSRMLGVVFDEPGSVAVLDVALLSDPEIGVAFGANSWRGDQYEAELRAAIASIQSDGSVRIGPFGIPTARKRPG